MFIAYGYVGYYTRFYFKLIIFKKKFYCEVSVPTSISYPIDLGDTFFPMNIERIFYFSFKLTINIFSYITTQFMMNFVI